MFSEPVEKPVTFGSNHAKRGDYWSSGEYGYLLFIGLNLATYVQPSKVSGTIYLHYHNYVSIDKRKYKPVSGF